MTYLTPAEKALLKLDAALLDAHDAALAAINEPLTCSYCGKPNAHYSKYERLDGVARLLCDECDVSAKLPGNDNGDFLPLWQALTKDRSVDDE